jgi:uncharacterized repeat protein (TIGR01451 family)
MRTGSPPRAATRRNVLGLAVFVIMAAVMAAPFYSALSSSSRVSRSSKSKAPGVPAGREAPNRKAARVSPAPLAEPLFSGQSIATFAADCATPQADFNLGDTVCVKATGVPLSLFPWRISWVDPAGFIRQSDPAIVDDAATYTYIILSADTSLINGQSVDNRGTWRVNLTRPTGAIIQEARFVVHEPASPVADVFVQKFQRDAGVQFHTGGNIAFIVQVGNAGPDPAQNVHLTDSAPSGATLVSFTENSGPDCTPVEQGGPLNDCVVASMANGDVAEFTAIYNLGSNQPGAYSTSSSASSATADSDANNNSSTVSFNISAGSDTAACDLTCPSSLTVNADTTENGMRGAHVTFPDAVGTGTCGAITATPASGSFFPVGTTIVSVSSEQGDGGCTFAVTVVDANGNVTISCPPNKTANADNNCQASVDVGTPTTTGDNVTVTNSRSDGKPLTDPFPTGTTTVTWIAYSHDAPGPYNNPDINPTDNEETHRTGSASCTQTVTVNDVTPPVIVTAPQTASADANCQAVVPDFTTTAVVTDNCACNGNDNSDVCSSRTTLTVTQSPAPGTVVGLGPHTITLTANDGSSNNNGTGNTATVTTTFTVNDTTPPTITPPANITAYTGPGATTCDTQVNPGTATATDNCGTPSISRSPSGNTFPVGTTTVTWTATDAAGNSSTATQTVTVIDNTPPTIAAPPNVTAYTGPGATSCGTTVSNAALGTPVASDNCSVSITRSPSGNTFPVGTTTVTWTATDPAGNHSSATQTVTVIDNTPPVINLNGQTPSLWPPNHKYSTFKVTDFVASVFDNCDTVAVGNVVITQVTSDEAENSSGDGNTLNDIVIAGDCKSVQLRSERDGGGNGRVYTIYFKLVDSHGNVGTASARVVVAHNPGETVVDSGVHYTVTSSCQ